MIVNAQPSTNPRTCRSSVPETLFSMHHYTKHFVWHTHIHPSVHVNYMHWYISHAFKSTSITALTKDEMRRVQGFLFRLVERMNLANSDRFTHISCCSLFRVQTVARLNLGGARWKISIAASSADVFVVSVVAQYGRNEVANSHED